MTVFISKNDFLKKVYKSPKSDWTINEASALWAVFFILLIRKSAGNRYSV